MTESTPSPRTLHPLAQTLDARGTAEAVLFEIRRVIVGQDKMLERVLVALLAEGHLLLEGVPGLAKTLTIETLADVLHGSFKRIQFTPDLVPSDLVGTRIYRPNDGTFDTSSGPVFANFLLADEINRAPAKVQSALLEVMQERQVTIGPTTHPVPRPFLVMATQNPSNRRHLPAPRGPGRPVHAQGPARLPEPRRGGDRRRALARVARRGPADPVGRGPCGAPGPGARGLRRPRPRRLRGHAHQRDPPPGRLRPARAQALHLLRGQPARLDP